MIKKTFRFLGASQASGKEQTAMAEETKASASRLPLKIVCWDIANKP
jgi:hypothetical protein